MRRLPAPGGTLICHALSAALTISIVVPSCSHCMDPMGKLEDSDIYLAAVGLEGPRRKPSGHGSGKWEIRGELGKARQL